MRATGSAARCYDDRVRLVAAHALALVIGGALAWGAGACSGGAFTCDADTDCRGGPAGGICEASGWCSFPDDACPSHMRYGSHAGDGLAGTCVVPTADASSGSDPLATTGTSTPLDTTAAAGTAADTSEGTTHADTVGDPTCGDGRQDADELCDDGNDIVGDGCNPDCTPSGTIVWSMLLDGGAGEPDWANTVELVDDDIVVGAVVGLPSLAQPRILRIDPDGTTIWTTDVADDAGWLFARVWGLTTDPFAPSGPISFAASGNGSDGTDASVIGVIDAEGTVSWTVAHAGIVFATMRGPEGQTLALGSDALASLALVYDAQGQSLGEIVGDPFAPATGTPFDGVLDPSGVIATGGATTGEEQAWVRWVSQDATSFVAADPMLPAAAETLALAVDGATATLWAVGYSDDGGWLAAWSAMEPTVEPHVVTVSAPGNLHGVDVTPDGSVIAVGWDAPGASEDLVALKFDPTGELVWSQTWDGPGGGDDFLRDVAVASDGAIYVAGHVRDVDGSDAGYIARLSP